MDIAQGRQVEAGDWDAMRRERRQLTRAEWAAITSTRPVVRTVRGVQRHERATPEGGF